jgi:hypothetical protein
MLSRESSEPASEVAQRPKGRHRKSIARWPGATSLSRVARRFALVLFAESKWRKPGVRRMSLPVAVSLKRLATDFFVFCIVQTTGEFR